MHKSAPVTRPHLMVCIHLSVYTHARELLPGPSQGVGRKTAIAVFCGSGQLEGASMSSLRRKSVTVWVQHLEAKNFVFP